MNKKGYFALNIQQVLFGAFGLLFLASFLVRTINLSYNIPFYDEAVYVVIGRLGLYQHDWWSYNAASWVAGSSFLYPSLAALSYNLRGIV